MVRRKKSGKRNTSSTFLPPENLDVYTRKRERKEKKVESLNGIFNPNHVLNNRVQESTARKCLVHTMVRDEKLGVIGLCASTEEKETNRRENLAKINNDIATRLDIFNGMCTLLCVQFIIPRNLE